MDIQNRVVNYYKNNQFIQKYLKGIDQKTNEVVLNYNNENRRISIEKLEEINGEDNLIAFLEGRTVVPAEAPVFTAPATPEPAAPDPVAPVQPEPVAPVTVAPSVEMPESSAVAPTIEATPVPLEQAMLTSDKSLSESLNDIKLLTELKNKEGLDNVFKKIAVNPNTGLIDINAAITKITKNTMDEVKNAITNNYEFNTDLTSYGIDGKYTGKLIEGTSTNDEKIIRSFNNVKVVLEASRMYPEQVTYNDEQISLFMKTYINKVKEELNLNNITPDVVSNTPVNNIDNSGSEVPVSPNAGFADIFVLTVIVLVYAVIIINLILKLK